MAAIPWKSRNLNRSFKGLWSTLTGLAFPIGGFWFGGLEPLSAPQRLEQGYILILPGCEGRSTLNINIVRGLQDGGSPFAIEVHDWTTGLWPLFPYHLRHAARGRKQASRVVHKIMAYQDRYPGRPTFLVGHSGGCAVAVMALETLSLNNPVTAAVLLGPAISRRYDLTEALGKTTCGIWNFYSPLDLIFLTMGTVLLGTADGRHAVAAGAWGFRPPPHLPTKGSQLYQTRLHQCAYRPAMAASWHFGGHFGWANRLFIANWLSRILTLS